GHNVTFREMIEALARAAGVRPPSRRAPRPLVRAAAWAMEGAAIVTRRPPPLTRDHVRLLGREMYYTSARALAELGYSVSPFPAMVERAVRRWSKGALRSG
ncbi:MAG: NAD-dependent epimerase, partial [Bacillota bacterium]